MYKINVLELLKYRTQELNHVSYAKARKNQRMGLERFWVFMSGRRGRTSEEDWEGKVS